MFHFIGFTTSFNSSLPRNVLVCDCDNKIIHIQMEIGSKYRI